MSEVVNPSNPLAEAAARLQAFEDETASPQFVELTRILGARLARQAQWPHLEDYPFQPAGFVQISALMLGDLERGINGATGEPLAEGSVFTRLPSEELDGLWERLPDIAEIGFSPQFSFEVRSQLVQIGIIPAPEAADSATLDPTEIISEPIRDIDTAKAKIVDDARQRLLALDWSALGIDPEFAATLFDGAYALILRQSPMIVPVTMLSSETAEDRGRLDDMLPHQKAAQKGPYWLGMLVDEIHSEYATATRDLLFAQAVEIVARAAGQDPADATLHFAKNIDGPYLRACTRLAQFLTQHPEVVRRPLAED